MEVARKTVSPRNPLPEGSLAVGTGLAVMGVSAYGFLILAARALGPLAYAPLAVLWALTFLVGPGVYVPLEQEVARALAARRARGVGGGPVVRRAGVVGAGVTLALVAAVLAASGPLVERLLDDAVLVAALAISLVGYFAEHLLRGVLAGGGRFRGYGSVLALEGASRLLAALALSALGVSSPGAWGLALCAAPLAAAALAAPLTTALARTDPRGPLADGPPAPWAELSGALGALLAASLFAQLLVNAGPVAVRVLAVPAERVLTGRFLTALIVARAPLFLFAAVQAAFLPKLAGLAGAGRRREFRNTLRRLVAAVAGFAVVATAGCALVGPLLVRLLFGEAFTLARPDFALLAAASGAYMLALALAQALIAVAAYARLLVAWAAGTVAFVVVTASGSALLTRVELGYGAGAAVAAAAMWLLLSDRLRGAPVPAARAVPGPPGLSPPEP